MSHAAIVAREYGMPAVVGTGHATKRIRTGDRIRVDGSTGTVTVLSPCPFPPPGPARGPAAQGTTSGRTGGLASPHRPLAPGGAAAGR
jgi:hypothetical protein